MKYRTLKEAAMRELNGVEEDLDTEYGYEDARSAIREAIDDYLSAQAHELGKRGEFAAADQLVTILRNELGRIRSLYSI